MTLPSDAAECRLHGIAAVRVQQHGPGLTTWDLDVGEADAALFDPFIMVSLYAMTGPTFPPHPHAGFSVATYILPESEIGFVNQDSRGHRNRIPPGALHWTTAGSGVMHEEQPERDGAVARGFQIWIDHASDAREMAPDARHLRAHEVPERRDDGVAVRAVLGESNGLRSPLQVPTAVRIIDVALAPGARFRQALAPRERAFCVLFEGALADAGGAPVLAPAVPILALADGETGASQWTLVAGPEGARLLLFAGVPFARPRAQHGPFVGNDRAQLARFAADFAAGRFGRLVPFAQQDPNAVWDD